MGDQKRWFKVWGSIVGDPHFGELPLEDVARWALLGAYVAVHGTRGRLTVPGDARELCHIFRVDSKEAVIAALERLPNVHVTHGVNRYGATYPQCPNEEGKNRYGEFTVTLSNWQYYQDDSTYKERMKTIRAKRRVVAVSTSTSTSSKPRSSVESGSTGADDDPLPPGPAPRVSLNGTGPLAGTVAGLMASLRPVDTVPREVEEI